MVTNSSSTGYIIFNKTQETKPLVEFVKEVKHLIGVFNQEYSSHTTLQEVLQSCKGDTREFYPGETYTSFGDEESTAVGRVFDYALREGGETKNFKWWQQDSLR